MEINHANLQSAYVGFNAAFQGGLGQAQPQWNAVATLVPSSTRENEYGWLGKIPGMREWIGDRQTNNLAKHGYKIPNKDFELTLGVDRNDFQDDNLGMYNPLFTEMGMSTAAKPDELVYGLLKGGFTEVCYDGQPFFDADHPVLDENGNEQSVSNTGGGSGEPWVLMETRRALKPLIFQQRKAADNLIRKDDPKDENLFWRKEFIYGTDGRFNVGFAFWQMAFGSKQTLNATNYAAARTSMIAMKGDHGRPLGLMPNLLVVTPSNEGAAREILMAEREAAGATNVWRNSAELLVVPWLA